MWPTHDRASDQQALTLAAGQKHAVFADEGLHAHRHGLDIGVKSGKARCLLGIRFGKRGAVEDVVQDRSARGAAGLELQVLQSALAWVLW